MLTMADTNPNLPAPHSSVPSTLPITLPEHTPTRLPRSREPKAKKDSNVFVKITASIVKSKVPSLFATSGSTVHVLEVHNKITKNSFKIGKTFSDFDIVVKQMNGILGDRHRCDNIGCNTFCQRVKELMPPRTLISRTPEVARRREESFQQLLDFWFNYINTSRQSTCQDALAQIPNALIVFLFDGAKMNKRKFWIPPQRSHRGKRLATATIKEALRLADEERMRAADQVEPPPSPVSVECMNDSFTVESVLRDCGSFIVDVSVDHQDHVTDEVANMMQALRILIHQVEDGEQLSNIEAEVQEIIRQQRTVIDNLTKEDEATSSVSF